MDTDWREERCVSHSEDRVESVAASRPSNVIYFVVTFQRKKKKMSSLSTPTSTCLASAIRNALVHFTFVVPIEHATYNPPSVFRSFCARPFVCLFVCFPMTKVGGYKLSLQTAMRDRMRMTPRLDGR